MLGDAWDMAGTLLREAGKLDDAAAHQKKALDIDPDNVRYRGNYAILLMSKGELHRAYETLCASKSTNVDYLSFALGNVLRACGYAEKAIPHYQRFINLAPDTSEARMNEAMVWLQIGEMERAWAIWKNLLPDTKEALKNIPRWQGERVDHLLLHEEQGLGDALQCVRYIPLLRGRVGAITLQLHQSLQKLMQFNFPNVRVITLDDAPPPADARVQLMGLPSIFGTTLASIPASIPYLRIDKDWCAPWPERLSQPPQQS
jgi:tetratricopeptide (TPR) repeat protein